MPDMVLAGSVLGTWAAVLAAGVLRQTRRQRTGPALWLPVAGLALVLPLATLAWLAYLGHQPAPASAGDWLAQAPWGLSTAVLFACTALELARSRSRAQAALKRREQELLLAMESVDGGRWEWNLRSRRLSFEGEFYAQFGIYTLPEADRQAHWESRRHPEDAARMRDYLRRAMDGLEEHYDAEFRMLDDHGAWRWVMARGRVAERDAQGHPLRLIGMDMDVTARRATEEALRVSEAKYTTIYNTLPDPAGITRVSDGRYIEVNPAFTKVLGRQRDATVGHTSTELGIWATSDERVRLLDALRRDGQVTRLPLVAQRDGVRIPGLMSARSVLIDGEDCLVFVFQDMTEEQRTHDELLALNGLLQQAGRLARLGAWEDVPRKGLVYWSDVCYDIHGLPSGAPLPRNYIDTHVAPPWRDTMRAKFRECIRHRTEWSVEMQIIRADGRQVWVRARGEPVIEGGRLTRIRGVMQDIDESKRAEERLRQSEERFSRIFQLVYQPMGLSRRSDGQYKVVNPAWEALLGIPHDEAVGRTAIEMGIFSPEARAQMIEAVGQTGHLSGYEVVLRARDGSPRTVLQSMRAVEFDGEPCWLFSVQDISDRKRDEERVREREELLSLTVSAAALGLWDWDLQTGLVTGDTRWRAMRGAPTQEGPVQPVNWAATVPPEDIPRVNAEVTRHAAHPATPFDATWRIPQPQGGVRWIRNLGKIVGYDAGGQPQRMLGVALDVTAQREQEELLQRLAHFDALTGLPNRVHLAHRLQEAMDHARATRTQLGVAYLDLDGFKPVNDRLGHGAGDRLLVIVAGRLQRALRPVDCVARLGGDEFVILLPGLGTRDDCERMLDQLMGSIAAPYTLDTERVSVTASIGYTLYPDDDDDADALLRHADQAMYAAKQAGRNRFHGFDALHERAQREQRAQGVRLREGLAHAEFTLFLQPKVDLRTGAVVGAETLARWRHPERGLLAPGAFLPLMEGTDLEVAFGEWVFDTALATIAALQAQGLRIPLSVNIAAQHLQRPGFASWAIERLARHADVPTALVELEITESAALYDVAHVARELARLRELGVSVALDDFGTGYSSLTYLRRLPMDTLKIDQSFVHGMMGDSGDLAIVQGVIGLARSFGYRVIAEGVETIEQGQMLQQMGCPLAQGYCIARPMPVEDFTPWVAQWQLPPGWQRTRPF